MNQRLRRTAVAATNIRSTRWPQPFAASIGQQCQPPSAAVALGLQFQLEQSRWWSAADLLGHQLRQLDALIRFSARNVPHYAPVLGKFVDGTLTVERFARIPVLTRADVQQLGRALWSPAVPPRHGRIHLVSSSGSTGRPVTVGKTDVCNQLWKAFSLRFHLWHRHDLSGKLAIIKYTDRVDAVPPTGAAGRGWGPATQDLFHTGQTALLRSSTDIASQADWLTHVAPDYLVTYPSNLLALARFFIDENLTLPSLREVSTLGESLPADLRMLCRQAWDVPLSDLYSSEETGFVALQCPHHEHYHVQCEAVLTEVLNERNEPCGPGEVGRVVVTPLHNFATPLIRYELGDYAEVGEYCDCGRGSPVLNRILGRARNMARLPDGRLLRPSVGVTRIAEIVPVEQAQLVQRAPDHVEVRLVTHHQPDSEQEQRLRAVVNDNFDYPMRVTFVYLREIPRSPRDKFEDFVCEIAD